MDFKKQRPTYRRASGEGRLTAPGNHVSRGEARPAGTSADRRAKGPSGTSQIFARGGSGDAAKPTSAGTAADRAQARRATAPARKAPAPQRDARSRGGGQAAQDPQNPPAPKHVRKAVKQQRMFRPAASELAGRMGALRDVARTSASYTTAPGSEPRATSPRSAAAAEHALEDSRRRRARVARIAIAGVIAAVAVAVGVSFFAVRRDAVTAIEGNAFTYIMGQRVDLAEPVNIERQDSGWVAVGANGSFAMDGRPLYSEMTGEAFFGDRAMVVLPARQGAIRQVPARTRAKFENGLGVLVSNEGDTEPIESGFMYDGADTYTLLSEGRLIAGGADLMLPALSNIEATYDGHLYVYDNASGSLQSIEADSAVLEVDDGTMIYSLDVFRDALTCNGTEQLLLGSAASMPSIFD